MWDERVPIHVASELYDVEAFVAGRSSLRPFELAELPRRARPHARASAVPLRRGHALVGAAGRARDRARLLRPRGRGGPCAGGALRARGRVRRGQRLRRRRGARRPPLRHRLHRPRRAQLAARHRALGARDGLARRARAAASTWPSSTRSRTSSATTTSASSTRTSTSRAGLRVPEHGRLRESRRGDRAQPRLRVEPRPRRGRLRDHRRGLRRSSSCTSTTPRCSRAGRSWSGERGTFRLPEGMPSLPLIYSLRAVPRR